MSLIQYKKADGTWEELKSVICSGGNSATKGVVIAPTTDKTFDLSAYVTSGSVDFLLFFTFGSPVGSGGTIDYFRYGFVGGELVDISREDGYTSSQGVNKLVGNSYTDSGVFSVVTDLDYSYDIETCLLTINGATTGGKLGNAAFLIV